MHGIQLTKAAQQNTTRDPLMLLFVAMHIYNKRMCHLSLTQPLFLFDFALCTLLKREKHYKNMDQRVSDKTYTKLHIVNLVCNSIILG